MEFQQNGQKIPRFQDSSYFQQENKFAVDAGLQKMEMNEFQQAQEIEGSNPASLFQIETSVINRIENDSNNNIIQRGSDLQNVCQMLDNGNSSDDTSISAMNQIIKVQDQAADQNHETLKQLKEFLVDQIENMSLNDIYANYELLTNYCLKQQFLLQNKHFNPKQYFQGKKISQIQFNDIFNDKKESNAQQLNTNQDSKTIQNKPFEKQRKNFPNSKGYGTQLDYVKEVKEESFSVGSVTPQSPAQNNIIAGFQRQAQIHISTPVKKNSINLSSASTKLGFQPSSAVSSYINSSTQGLDMSTRSLLQSKSIQHGSNHNINHPQDPQKDELAYLKSENYNSQNTQASKEAKQKEKIEILTKKKLNLTSSNFNYGQSSQKSPKSKLVQQINNFEAQSSSNKNKNYISYIRDFQGNSANKDSNKQNLNINISKQNPSFNFNSASNLQNAGTNLLKNVQINLFSPKNLTNSSLENLNKFENSNQITTDDGNKFQIQSQANNEKKAENINSFETLKKIENQSSSNNLINLIKQENSSKFDNLTINENSNQPDNLIKLDSQNRIENLSKQQINKKPENSSRIQESQINHVNNFLTQNKSLSPKGQSSIAMKNQLTKKERFQNLQLNDHVYSSSHSQSQTALSRKGGVVNLNLNLNLQLSPKGSQQKIQSNQNDVSKSNDQKYENARKISNSNHMSEAQKQEIKKVTINPGNKERKSISIHLESTKYYQYSNEQPVSVKIDKTHKDSASKVTNSSNISQSPLSSQILKDQVKLKNEINKLSKLLESNTNKQEQNMYEQIPGSLHSTQQHIQSQTLINTASTSNTNKQSIDINKGPIKKQMHYTIPLIKDLNQSKVSSQALIPEDNGSHREIKDYRVSAGNSRAISPSYNLKDMRIPSPGNSLNNSNARLSSSLQPTPRDHHEQIHSGVINQNSSNQVARNIASVISILNNKVSKDNKSQTRGYNNKSINKSNPLSPKQRSLSRGKPNIGTPLLPGQIPLDQGSRNASQVFQSNLMNQNGNQIGYQNTRNLINSPSYGSIFQPQLSQKYTQIYQQMELLNQKFNIGGNNQQVQVNQNSHNNQHSNLNSNNGSQACLAQPNSSNTLRNSSKNNTKNIKKNI